MYKQSLVYEKAFAFSVRIVKLYQYLCNDKKEYVLSKQILRSGTSIGANIREGLEGQSKRDFLAKLSIALKEAAETEYWLELLIATEVLESKLGISLLDDVKELLKMLNSIVRTTKQTLKK
ncbi:four helix bundle protein [Aneurinibacillus aneurinilyticus]|uniref:Four helix bundle protein n=1 Tax=Aneurinibacillus aneurinilyticus TaxID=1391 RepID=A0A848CZI4_ANEAE|nr:four helix bundle protein [Aneurinibacillus aneurinilyticus]NMF00529.1 four helix bundle protein [Aneurinibacillus aneurinilyticus]